MGESPSLESGSATNFFSVPAGSRATPPQMTRAVHAVRQRLITRQRPVDAHAIHVRQVREDVVNQDAVGVTPATAPCAGAPVAHGAEQRRLIRSASTGETVPWRFGVQFRPTWPREARMSIAADAPRRASKADGVGRIRVAVAAAVAVVVRRVLLRAQTALMFQYAVSSRRRLPTSGAAAAGSAITDSSASFARLDACPPASRTREREFRSRRSGTGADLS